MDGNQGRIVPTTLFPFDYFDRQRSSFNQVSRFFNDDMVSFEKELARMRNEMFKFDDGLDLNLQQPFVEDIDGQKKFKLNFNCNGFKPEDVEVKTMGNQLTVHAKHEDSSGGQKSYREFTKSCTLPPYVDPISLKSHLTNDGVLAIEAPAPKEVEANKDHLVPIEQM